MCHIHLKPCIEEVIVSVIHSLSFSIKPFAQPPYPSLSGPVPQSIPSKCEVKICENFFKNPTKNEWKCFLNVFVCSIQVMSPWHLLLHHLLLQFQCGRTEPSPPLSCGCWSTQPSWRSRETQTTWVNINNKASHIQTWMDYWNGLVSIDTGPGWGQGRPGPDCKDSLFIFQITELR